MIPVGRFAAIFGWFLLAVSADAVGLEGRILEDHTGSPLASAAVRVFKQGVRNLAADLESDSQGRFRAPGLPADEYRIEITKPNFVGATAHITVPADASAATALVIRLVRCGVITGSVLDHQGRPLGGVRVFALAMPADGGPLRPPAGTSQGITAEPNARGEFRLYNLAPGQYEVALTYRRGGAQAAPGGTTIGSGVLFYPDNTQPQIFTVSGGEEFRGVNFAFRTSALYSVSGKLQLPAPKKRYSVALTAVDQTLLCTSAVLTDDEGGFALTGIPPGSYTLFVSGPAMYRGTQGAVLGTDRLYAQTRVDISGRNVEGLSLALQPGRLASFLLRPAAGCPSTAQLKLTPLDDWGAFLDQTVEVNSAKETVVDNLAPARYYLSVSNLSGACYQAAAVVADLAGGAESMPYTVPVAPAGSLRGRLTGAARPGDFVVVLVPGDAVGGAQPVQLVLPGGDGKFNFAGLRPGHYRIAAQPASDSRARWIADISKMLDIEVFSRTPTEIDLPAPVKTSQ